MSDIDFVMTVRKVSGTQFTGDVASATSFLEVPEHTDPSPAQKVAATSWYTDVLAAAAWKNSLGEDRGDILFVVHGYNDSASESMDRHRRIRRGLAANGFRGVVVSFDWPSGSSALAYLPDRHQAKITALRLVTEGISQLSRRQRPDCPTNVHVLGHSTGAYVIREAFDDADDTQVKNPGWSVSQVLLIAGDVSAGSMSQDNPGAESIYRHCIRVTNYFNRRDVVLDVSNVKRAGLAPRVGRVGLPSDAPRGAVNVDCTNYFDQLDGDPNIQKNDMQGGQIVGEKHHSWYFGNAPFSKDLFLTLIGTDPQAMPTRDHGPDGVLRLIRG